MRVKSSLIDFKGIHEGKWCYVCGSGESIKDFKPRWGYTIIGVNDITPHADPGYLVLSETLNYDGKHDEKINRILNSKYDYAFSLNKRMNFTQSPTINYGIMPWNGMELEGIFEKEKLFACVSTSEVALGLALYMGFSFIGLIGIDFIGYGYDNQLDEINKCYEAAYKYGQRHGQYVYNLSEVSLITGAPYIPHKYFRLKD